LWEDAWQEAVWLMIPVGGLEVDYSTALQWWHWIHLWHWIGSDHLCWLYWRFHLLKLPPGDMGARVLFVTHMVSNINFVSNRLCMDYVYYKAACKVVPYLK